MYVCVSDLGETDCGMLNLHLRYVDEYSQMCKLGQPNYDFWHGKMI